MAPDPVVVTDGLSSDGSREWLRRLAAQDPTFLLVDNLDRIVPAASTWPCRTELTFVAAVCAEQADVQDVGVPYRDVLGLLLSEGFLLQGYNTGDPLFFGSPIYRVHGILILESSFVSYFLGLAAVIALYLGRASLVVGRCWSSTGQSARWRSCCCCAPCWQAGGTARGPSPSWSAISC